MRSNTTAEPLFLINPDASMIELNNAVHERLTKIKAITNFMLADLSDGDPNVSTQSQCDALWLIEGLADEADQIMAHSVQKPDLKAAIHPSAASKASEKNSPYGLRGNELSQQKQNEC